MVSEREKDFPHKDRHFRRGFRSQVPYGTNRLHTFNHEGLFRKVRRLGREGTVSLETGPFNRLTLSILKKKIPNIEGPLAPAFLWDFSNVLLCAERVPREERAAAGTDVLNRARVAVGIQAYAEYFDALRSLVSAGFGKGRHVLFVPETVHVGNGKPIFRMYDGLAGTLVASGKFSALRFDKKDLDSEMLRFAKTLKAR